MLEQISTRIAFVLFDASLKAILIWALAVLVIRAFRGMSVHARHRVWTVVLLALLMLPILACTGPFWSIPTEIWPAGNWPPEGSAASSDVGNSHPAFAGPGTGDLDGRNALFPGRSSNRRQDDSRNVPSSGAGVGHERSRRLPIGVAPLETDGRSDGGQASALAASHRQAFLQGPSLPVIGSTVWLAGVGVMLVRLSIGVHRSLQIRRASQLVADAFFPTGTMVRESEEIESPVVVGWWRPCILLPRSWREWTAAKRAAVFSHELSHLRRRDTQLSLLTELVTLLYWFHPVSWWTRRQLRQNAELACDEAAAVAIGDRLAYARYLVEIAAANRKNTRLPAGAAMARSSEVGRRVRAMLDLSRPLTARLAWPTLATILLVGIPVAILLAGLRPKSVNTTAHGKEPPSLARPEEAPAPSARTRSDAEPEKEKQTVAVAGEPAGVADGPVLTMKGTVLMPDGSVAKDAVLERSTEDGPSDVLGATITEGQFEIRTTGTKLNPAGILIRTPDWNFQASLRLGDHTLRSESATPKKVVLVPTRVIRVKVTDDKQAVADCHVQVNAGSYDYLGTTRSDGVAEVKIAQNESVFLIYAWTDDHRIGGLHAARKPTKDQYGTDFLIEISHAAPVRVRVVDARLRPVANVPLRLTAVAGRHGEMFVGDNPMSRQTSDANGEALFAWVPDWPDKRIHVSVAENTPWRRMNDGVLKQMPNEVQQLELTPARTNERVAVMGQLSGVTTDVSGLLVEFWSFQGEEESTCDVLYARCDANGQFSARVLPGSEYSVYVNDRELVSNIWDGVIVLARGATVRRPELTLTKGVPVEIHVTKGGDRRPMQNAWLHLETPHKHLCGRRFWGKTDERGRFTAPVAAGELKVRVNEGDWNLEKTIQIVDAQPAKVELHRQHVDKRTIVGKLVLPPGVAADVGNTTVTVAGMDGESEDTVTVTTDGQGRFSAGIIAGRVSILATSPKEEFFGCGIVDVREGVIEIPMYPTIHYEGHVLGSQDQPLPGVTVRMLARLVDRDREHSPGTPDFSRQYAELFHDRNVVTDAEGHFVLPRTPQRMELSIWFTRPGETESAAYRQKYFEPGQTRPPEIIRIGPARKNASRATKPLEAEMSDTLRDCRLAGIHALVVVSGGGDIAAPFTKTRILDTEETDEEIADIDSYLPKVIDGPEAAKLPDRRAYFAAHKWPFPGTNSLFLAALDGEGRELARRELDLRDDQAAAKDVAAFLKKHLPPQRDAKAGYEAALAEARRSHRRVWVCVGQTRCGPCFSFSRWLDSQRELLAKDYVLFKFDDVRDRDGRELSVALNFDAHGVPCHSILDSDGKELINSIGPLGNIGDPSGSFEGVQHLRKMLKTTARNLSNDEVDTLIRSVPEE